MFAAVGAPYHEAKAARILDRLRTLQIRRQDVEPRAALLVDSRKRWGAIASHASALKELLGQEADHAAALEAQETVPHGLPGHLMRGLLDNHPDAVSLSRTLEAVAERAADLSMAGEMLRPGRGGRPTEAATIGALCRLFENEFGRATASTVPIEDDEDPDLPDQWVYRGPFLRFAVLAYELIGDSLNLSTAQKYVNKRRTRMKALRSNARKLGRARRQVR